jgi:hypothetical protein
MLRKLKRVKRGTKSLDDHMGPGENTSRFRTLPCVTRMIFDLICSESSSAEEKKGTSTTVWNARNLSLNGPSGLMHKKSPF